MKWQTMTAHCDKTNNEQNNDQHTKASICTCTDVQPTTADHKNTPKSGSGASGGRENRVCVCLCAMLICKHRKANRIFSCTNDRRRSGSNNFQYSYTCMLWLALPNVVFLSISQFVLHTNLHAAHRFCAMQKKQTEMKYIGRAHHS